MCEIWDSRRVEDVGYSIWVMMPCRLVEMFYTLNMDAENSVEIFVSFTRPHGVT